MRKYSLVVLMLLAGLIAVAPGVGNAGDLKDLLLNVAKGVAHDVGAPVASLPPSSQNTSDPEEGPPSAYCREFMKPRGCALYAATLPPHHYIVDGYGYSDLDGPVNLVYFLALLLDPSGGADVDRNLGPEARAEYTMPVQFEKGNAFDRRDLQAPSATRAQKIEAQIRGGTFVFPVDMNFFDYDFATHSFPIAIDSYPFQLESEASGRRVIYRCVFDGIPYPDSAYTGMQRQPHYEPNYHLVVTDEAKARRLLKRLNSVRNPVIGGIRAMPTKLFVRIDKRDFLSIEIRMKVKGFVFVDYRGQSFELLD